MEGRLADDNCQLCMTWVEDGSFYEAKRHARSDAEPCAAPVQPASRAAGGCGHLQVGGDFH